MGAAFLPNREMRCVDGKRGSLEREGERARKLARSRCARRPSRLPAVA